MSKYKLISLLFVFVLLGSFLNITPGALASDPECAFKMPPNPDKILTSLIEQGVISADASPEDQKAALEAYLQLKLAGCDPDQAANPLARKKIDAAESTLNQYTGAINGRKLGIEPEVIEPSTPKFKPLEGTDELLVILVDFSDEEYTWTTATGEERTEAGPLYNSIPQPENDFDLWVSDFSEEHFQKMLFTPGGWTIPEDHPYYPGELRGSMYDYFIEMSFGKYAVDGQTYGWFTVDKPEAYYGDDDPDGGSDSLRPGTPRDFLTDAVDVINAAGAINWLEYDILDLYDMDKDGNINEPDCIIDHPLFVHAGVDQSGGGGEQEDDAIWAHSASTDKYVSSLKNPDAVCPADWEGTKLYNYTIMPEDGGVGVFAHEFAHDLGLPDEYDTSGAWMDNSTAFWTLQSSGSWLGRPAQTQPAAMSVWARYVLGWVDPDDNLAVFHIDDLGKDPMVLRVEQAELWGGEGTINAVKVNLPDKYYYVNDPYSGEWEWFGGKADESDTTLRRTVDLTGKTSAELSFYTWYDIELDWDYGFVQVSTDGGVTWTSLPIEGTSSDAVADAMPSIVANLPGFTGNSGGWLPKTYDLVDYLGQTIELQFRYMTDWASTNAGFYVDDIGVTADGEVLFFDDVEVLDEAWTVAGWTREQGSGYKEHYYIMEWRNLLPFEVTYEGLPLVNFDAGLNNAYQFTSTSDNPSQPIYFPYAPGLLLFYRDMSYTDNWTEAHPGAGFLLLVDAHKRPLISPYSGEEWYTRIQSYDAAFSLEAAPDITLTDDGITKTYNGLPAAPYFNDAHSYWSEKAPSASVITPDYGLVFRIVAQAEDKSAIALGFGNKTKLDEELYMSALADYFSIFERVYLPALAK